MTILSEKNKTLFVKFKWLIILGIPLLFFIIVISYFLTSNNLEEAINGVNPRITPASNISGNKISDEVREGNEESIDERPGIIKRETLPDKTTLYTFNSKNPTRPHIIIAKDGHDIFFQRTVTNPRFPVKITDYTESYGPAKWIFKGSNFYGPLFQSYIYPELGFAFIGNPTSGEVMEQHVFPPTKVEDYVSKYGDDIPAQP
jgi:hypothetical protein